MNNKKIISLVCALAMVFSMFSAFTVVNAENTKGIALTGEISKDLKVITINATATGETANKLNSFQIELNVPENSGITADTLNSKVAATSPLGALTVGFVDGKLRVGILDLSGDGLPFTNKKLAEIKITLDGAISGDYVATLQDNTTFDDGTEVKVGKGTMDAATVTIQDPNKKPATETRPGENTDTDDEPTIPSDVPVTSDKGIALKASLDKTGKVVTIEATAAGTTTDKLNSFQIELNVPENSGITADTLNSKVAATSPLGALTVGLVDGKVRVGILDLSGDGLPLTNKKLAEIKITLDEAITDYFEFKLQDNTTFDDGTEVKVGKGTMTAASAVAKPADASKPTGKTVALKDYVAKEGPAAAAAAQADGKTVYLTVKVTDKDGNEAAYGTDYIAQYNGKDLTKKEYENLIHGYTDGANMADVISNLKFVVYNSTNAYKITTTLNAEGEAEQLVQPTKDKVIGGKPDKTQSPSKASMSLKASSTSINVNSITRVTAKITDATDAKEVGDSVKFKITSGSSCLEFVDKTDADGYITEALKDGEATVKVNATEKTGTAKVTAYYTYTDKDGVEQPVEQTVSITVKKQTTSNGGSDSEGKGGAISQGVGIIGTQPGTINFVDLDTVTWAQDAILRLVDKKVINGRSNTIFDPNGTVTRAEFAKMVVLGFGLTGGTSGNFSDVDTSAWYNTYVQVGYANDVISGYDDGTFRPNGLISRQEMAAMISRAVKAANKNLPATVAAANFSDVSPATEWGYAEISALQTAGVINGMTATTFEPYSNATRAQAAVIIDRAMTNAK